MTQPLHRFLFPGAGWPPLTRHRPRREPDQPESGWLTFAQRVLELVRMLPALDNDFQRSSKAHQLVGARIGHHGDRQLRLAACHCAGMLEREAAFAVMQRASYALDRDLSA